MVTEKHIADAIRHLAKARGWKVSYASRMAAGNGDAVARLDAGIGITLRRANQIMRRVAELWPADLEWPADIPRPSEEEGVA